MKMYRVTVVDYGMGHTGCKDFNTEAEARAEVEAIKKALPQGSLMNYDVYWEPL